MNHLLECARRGLRGRYVRLLEEEVARGREAVAREQAELARERGELAREREEAARQRAEIDRLRMENRALINSLLGTAGVPPLAFGNEGGSATAVSPVRRRSWAQISAAREIEAAREALEREREARRA